MTLSIAGAREGGSLVESIERRTEKAAEHAESRGGIPGNWAERARTIARNDVVRGGNVPLDVLARNVDEYVA